VDLDFANRIDAKDQETLTEFSPAAEFKDFGSIPSDLEADITVAPVRGVIPPVSPTGEGPHPQRNEEPD
jgi:hypothetical protein